MVYESRSRLLGVYSEQTFAIWYFLASVKAIGFPRIALAAGSSPRIPSPDLVVSSSADAGTACQFDVGFPDPPNAPHAGRRGLDYFREKPEDVIWRAGFRKIGLDRDAGPLPPLTLVGEPTFLLHERNPAQSSRRPGKRTNC